MNKKILIGVIIVLFIGIGVVAYKVLQPEAEQPTLEQANVILAESIQNTLDLNSFTVTGDGVLEIRDGETILLKAALEDVKASIINPFDFANQDSSSVLTYSILMNFEAIADFIEDVATPEELEGFKTAGEMFQIDFLATMRELEEANILVTMETRSIGPDSYMKLVEVAGLKKVVTQIGGVFLADMLMGEIDPYLGVWHKMPADPTMEEERTVISEETGDLILAILNVSYVKEVLPNTEVNGTPVYSFVSGVHSDELRDAVIPFILPLIEKAEISTEDKEMMMAGMNEAWPKIVETVKTVETDSRTYICQKTRFIVKETIAVNLDLHELMVTLETIMQERETEATPEEEAEFARVKEVVRNINITATTNLVFSDHNAVPAIMPPAEYEVIEEPVQISF
jgi:thioredoxin-related protein